MADHLISVLLPVREHKPYTNRAIESLLNQTHDEIEILVVGQSDVGALKKSLPADSRIRVIPRDASGIVGALNTSLAAAQGEYIARMDDDDVSHPQRLATQLHYLQTNSDIGLCGARIRFFSDLQEVGQGNQRYASWLNELVEPAAIHDACFIECPMPHPTLFAHREVWRSLGGYRDLPWPEDYDLILRAWLKGIAMGKPEAVLFDWHEHPQRLTREDKRYSREAFIKVKAWALFDERCNVGLSRGRSVWICGTGRNARYWFDALIELGVVVRGFVDIDRAGSGQSGDGQLGCVLAGGKLTKRGRPVIGYDELRECCGDSLVVSALTNGKAREELVRWFEKNGWRSMVDYVLGG